MNRKNSIILGVVIILLLAVLLLSNNAEDRSIRKEKNDLFSDINTDDLGGLLLQQGEAETKLAFANGQWVVSARGDYPADSNKLRSLLLKIIQLTVSQKVTDADQNYASLGVADDSYKKGDAKVTLLKSDGKELASLLAGEKRKKTKEAFSAEGQFIRRGGQNVVYLASDPLEVAIDPTTWIRTELLSIPQSKIRRVVQEQLVVTDGAESKQKVFELNFVPDGDKKGKFEIDLQPGPGQEVQEPTVNTVLGALENLRISDVLAVPAMSDELKGRPFDEQTTYELSTGAVYEVRTFVYAGKNYAKISVHFNPEHAHATESETAAQNEKNKKELDEKNAADEKSSGATPKEFTPVKADVTTSEDVSKLNQGFEPWLYEFANYQMDKFRRSKADLLKSKSTEPPSEPSQ